MIAAFDFRSWSGPNGRRPRLLFVAHRQEILKQSLYTFRAVLRDQNFGDLWVGEHVAENHDHLFVSIQTYNSQRLWERMPPEHYDYVVVDEFHRAGAAWYDRLLGHVRPKVLLGLTATPERADGVDVLRYFGGHLSAEIRLPDAVNRKLLCPFQYFGISDSLDLSGLSWQRGGYRLDELDRLYTGNDHRASLVIQKLAEVLLDVRQARGLGFCVSIAHATYMAEKFRQVGIPAEALSAETGLHTRNSVQRRLREREINFLFVVDLFNEGVDIPEVDTVLFLRSRGSPSSTSCAISDRVCLGQGPTLFRRSGNSRRSAESRRRWESFWITTGWIWTISTARGSPGRVSVWKQAWSVSLPSRTRSS